MENIMIFVIGAFDAGKTEFIRTLCGNVETYLSHKDKDRPFAYDHGQLTITKDIQLHFFGNPGAVQPSSAWEVFDYEATMLGFIIMVDSGLEEIHRRRELPINEGLWEETRAIIGYVQSLNKYPYVVAANKQDKRGALRPVQLKSKLKLNSEIILPSVAINRESNQQIVLSLLSLIPPSETITATISIFERLS